MNATHNLFELLYYASPDINLADCFNEVKTLVSQGANVNFEIEDSDYSYFPLTLVCNNLSSEYDTLRTFNFQVAEYLVLLGAKVNTKCYKYYSQFDEDEPSDNYTPLDYVILEGGKYGINQDTYRLAKVMVTSLHQNGMRDYLRKYKNPDTFHGLKNIFKEFGYFDKYIEYMF